MGVAPRVCSWHTSGHTIMSVNVFEPISESKLRTPHTQLARRNTRRARSVAPPVETWPKHTGSLPPVEFFQMETQHPVEYCRQGSSMKSLRFARWSTHNVPCGRLTTPPSMLGKRVRQKMASACVKQIIAAVDSIEGRHTRQAHACA